MRVKTPNQAAGDTRRQIVKMIQRKASIAHEPGNGGVVIYGVAYICAGDLIADIHAMAKRAGKKPGGLGRK